MEMQSKRARAVELRDGGRSVPRPDVQETVRQSDPGLVRGAEGNRKELTVQWSVILYLHLPVDDVSIIEYVYVLWSATAAAAASAADAAALSPLTVCCEANNTFALVRFILYPTLPYLTLATARLCTPS